MEEEESIGEKFGGVSSPVWNSIRRPFAFVVLGSIRARAPNDRKGFWKAPHGDRAHPLGALIVARGKSPSSNPAVSSPVPSLPSPLRCGVFLDLTFISVFHASILSPYSESFHVLWRGRVRIHTRMSNEISSKFNVKKVEKNAKTLE